MVGRNNIDVSNCRESRLRQPMLEQQTECSRILNETTSLKRAALWQILQAREQLTGTLLKQNLTRHDVLEEYRSSILQRVESGTSIHWKKTQRHTLWRPLKAHSNLIQLLHETCRLV